MSVREIRGWTPATALPHAPSYVRGVINLRGSVLPIVDLARAPRLSPTEATARHVIIVVQVGAQIIGLLVDAVSDILSQSTDDIQPTPEVATDSVKSFVRGMLAIDGRMIGLIGLDAIMSPNIGDRGMNVRAATPTRGARDRWSSEFEMTSPAITDGSRRCSTPTPESICGKRRRALVYSRLVKRLRALNLKSFDDYCDLVGHRRSDERLEMLSALTTNVTRFFRERHHFEHLQRKSCRRSSRRRARAAKFASGRPAARPARSLTRSRCSLLSLEPQAHRLDVKILATDIDPRVVVEAGRGGVYPEAALAEVPARICATVTSRATPARTASPGVSPTR